MTSRRPPSRLQVLVRGFFGRRTPTAFDPLLRRLLAAAFLCAAALLAGVAAFLPEAAGTRAGGLPGNAALPPAARPLFRVGVLLALTLAGLALRRVGALPRWARHGADLVLQGAALFVALDAPLAAASFAVAAALTCLTAATLRSPQSDAAAAAGLLAAAAATVFSARLVGGEFGQLLALPGLSVAFTGLLCVHARVSRRQLSATAAARASADGLGPRGRATLGSVLAILLVLAVPAALHLSARVTGPAWPGTFATLDDWTEVLAGRGRTAPPQGEDLAPSADPAPGADGSGQGGRRFGRGAAADGAADGALGRDEAADGVTTGARASDSADQPARIGYPDTIRFDGARLLDGPRTTRLMLRMITPASTPSRFGPNRPAYLQVDSYDGFGPDGLTPTRSAAVYELSDAGDGVVDGWTRVRDDPARGNWAMLELQCVPLRAAGSDPPRLIVPRIEPLIAIGLPRVRHREGGLMTVRDEGQPLVAARMQVRLPDFEPLLANELPWAAAPGARALPEDDPVWAAALAEIRVQLDELPADEPLLRAVLGHFRRGYRYALDAPGGGPAGLATFLRDRRGSCTYFATAAMMMLRARGVPARVASGYRVTRWDEERAAWVAGDQGAHAWVEIAVAGRGWLPIDPTPPRQLNQVLADEGERLAAAAAARGDASDPLNPAGEEEAEPEPGGAADGATGDAARAAEADAAPSATAAGADGLGVHPALILGLLTALAVLLIRGARGARFDESAPAEPAAAPPALADGEHDDYRRALDLLRHHGYPTHRAQTPLEFAERAARDSAGKLAPLRAVAWYLYARRYGGAPPAWHRVEDLERALQPVTD